MNYLYMSVIYVAIMVEQILFYRVIFRRKMAAVSWKRALPLLVPYALLMLLLYHSSLISFIIYIVDFYVQCTFIQIGVRENIKYWFLSILVISAAEYIIVMALAAMFFEPSFNFLRLEQMIANIIMVLVLFVADKLLYKKRKDEMTQISLKVFLFLILVVGGAAFCLSGMAYLLMEVERDDHQKMGFFILLLVMVGVFLAIYVILYLSWKKEQFRIQSALESRYNEQQRDYFLLLLEKEEDTRRFRHDTIHHLLCIQDAVKNENYQDADSHLSDMLSGLNEISHRQYDMGDEVINVMLNYYLVPLQDKCDILVEGYLGKLENMSQMDTCTIFSNLLRNAVEAVQESGQITVEGNRGKDFTRILISNTYTDSIKMTKRGIPETTKKDAVNHGFGLENVKRTVRKNCGEFYCRIDDSWFETEVILPNKMTVYDKN